MDRNRTVEITSPYNFVPFPKAVFYPDASGDVPSQDKPFKDGEDLIIEVEVTNHSPLFVRNGHKEETASEEEKKWKAEKKPKLAEEAEKIITQIEEGKESNYSSFLGQVSDNTKQYFIPATTIKGAIRSTLEIMSFGELKQYYDNHFGYRDLGGSLTTDGNFYTKIMKDAEAGWLSYDANTETYTLYPCIENYEKISLHEVETLFPIRNNRRNSGYNRKSPIMTKYKVIGNKKDRYPILESHGGKRLVCTGSFNFNKDESKNKQHEYLFSEGGNPEPVSNDVIEKFKKVYQRTKHFDAFVMKHLKAGKRLAVFFLKDSPNGQPQAEKEVVSLGLSRMYKIPYTKSIKDGINQDADNTKLDLCDTIFGSTDDLSCKGRVHIGHAMLNGRLEDPPMEAYIFGEPAASFYPMYLKQSFEKGFITYDSDHIEISGRKRYRVMPAQKIMYSARGNGNLNVKTWLRPLPSGQKFSLKIRVHNLRPFEIGALISALTFHQTPDVFHTIGQGKSFGLGKTSMSITNIKRIDNDCTDSTINKGVNDYLECFAEVMNKFCMEQFGKDTLWYDQECIQKLLKIASPTHYPYTMRFMQVQYGYKLAKENANKKTVLNCMAEPPKKRQHNKRHL